ncbi:MAG: OmpH family outer membrane protein [Phycisphaerales bacterium JB064]
MSHTQASTVKPRRAHAGVGVLAAIAIGISTVALLKPTADASSVVRATPTPVATVDLVQVITSLKEFENVDKRIKAEGEKKKKEIEALDKQIQGLNEDLKSLDPNTDAYDQIFRELNMKMGIREVTAGNLIRWQSEDNARVLTELYEKATKAVAEVAKRDGWEVVVHRGQNLTVPRNPNVRAEAAMDFVENFIQTRRVIYSGDAVDITNNVIQTMNNRFESGG